MSPLGHKRTSAHVNVMSALPLKADIAKRRRWNPGFRQPPGQLSRKWITRERVKVDRVACLWLIKKFVDKRCGVRFRSARQSHGRSKAARHGSLRRQER
jgi:cell division inhibitor SulA